MNSCKYVRCSNLPLVWTEASCYPATALLGCGSVPTPPADMKTEGSTLAYTVCVDKCEVMQILLGKQQNYSLAAAML